jgi:16S rRNA (guanine527-N7)-methyltransferase
VNGPGSLTAALDRARTLGFLGPGPVEAHAAHAAGFAATIAGALGRPPVSVLDLGSGGGVPGLVLAQAWPGASVRLVESSRRRAEHLRQAVAELGWTNRVLVLEERAEVVAHDPDYREHLEVVTARSFAEPAATAEIAAGLVAVGGYLVVSEPPDERAERWPPAELEEIGFGVALSVEQAVGHFVLIEKLADVPGSLPRRVGRPAKRPRW